MEVQIRKVEQIVKYIKEFCINKFAFHRKHSHELPFCIL